MAETIELKEKASSGMSRIFNRVDSVELTPALLYDAYEIAEEDRATFTIKPANAVIRDELKQILLSFTVIQSSICDDNGISMSDLNSQLERPTPRPKKAKETKAKREEREQADKLDMMVYATHIEKIGLSLQQFKQATEYEKSSKDAREMLSKCVVGISNFKEQNAEEELLLSKKSTAEIMQDIPSIFCVWLFEEIQKLSNLTTDEVLGL